MSALSVFRPLRFAQLMLADATNISRDPMLLIAIVMSLFPSAGLALGRDALDQSVLAAFGAGDFSHYLVPVALLIPAMLIGWVTGFLLLEDRDEGTLPALDITPVGKRGFLTYRVSVTALVTALVTLLALRLLTPELSVAMAVVMVVLVAAEAVAAAVVLPALARNKVEGLALTKLTNLMGVVPLVAIIASPLRYLAGILPPFWIGEALELSGAPYLPMGVIVVLALLSHAVLIAGLFWLFGRRVG
ncbi:MAG: hypothetical protein ABL866_11555 [Devosia sp.]